MVLAQSLYVVAKCGVPTGVIALAVGQSGQIVALTVGLSAIPALCAAPVTAQVEFCLGCQALDDLPCQRIVHANTIAVCNVAVVVQDVNWIIVVLRVSRTHTEVRWVARTEWVVDGVEGVSLCGIAKLGTLDPNLAIAGINVPFQVLGDVLRELEVTAPTTETRVEQNTRIVAIVERCIVLCVLCTAADAYVVVPGVARIHHVVHPVVRTLVLVFGQMIAVVAAQSIELCYVVGVGGTIGCGIAPLMEHVVVSVHDVQLAWSSLHLIIHIIFYGSLTFLGSLGGDKDYTVCTTGTIDSSRGSIFQHVDALDIVGRDIIDARYLNTVYHIERFVRLSDRTATTNADRHCGTWATVLRNNVYTR